jgi:hypothetical protein
MLALLEIKAVVINKLFLIRVLYWTLPLYEYVFDIYDIRIITYPSS